MPRPKPAKRSAPIGLAALLVVSGYGANNHNDADHNASSSRVSSFLSTNGEDDPADSAPDEADGPNALAEASDQVPQIAEFDPSMAVAYVGGSPEAADDELEPVRIGWVVQDAGPGASPESTSAAEAAVDFINAELGGIRGRPLELEICSAPSAEETQQCGVEFANNDDIRMIVQGPNFVGGQESLYRSASSTDKAVIIALPSSPEEITAQGPYAFLATGGVPQEALAQLIKSGHLGDIESVTIVHLAIPAAESIARTYFEEQLSETGIDVQRVPVQATATAPEIQAAVQAAGGGTADIVIGIVAAPGCISIPQALDLLQSDALYTGVSACLAPSVIEALGGIYEGYYATTVSNYLIPDDESGTRIYLGAMQRYGTPDIRVDYLSGNAFAAIMNAARFLNEVGPDDMNEDSFRAAAEAFEGPAWMAPGPMTCGEIEGAPAMCGRGADIYGYIDGEWSSVRSTITGDPYISGE